MFKGLVQLMRLHHYVKNLFLFAPLLFSFHFTIDAFISVAMAFALFSMAASAIYIFNDWRDIDADRMHPTKSLRPLASGVVRPIEALSLSVVLVAFALIGAYVLAPLFFGVLLSYIGMNVLYSIALKHVAIIDIVMIAVGFVLRLFAGSVVVDAPLSMWIIIMTFLLALFMGVAKRRDDVLLSHEGKATRKNIAGYNLEFVNATMVLMAGVIIVAYILYTVSPDVIARTHGEYLYVTALFVIVGILRYMQIVFVEQKSASPTRIVLSDRFLQSVIVLWLVSFYLIVKVV